MRGDLKREPDETFFAVLSRAKNSTIGDGVGMGTILNDDTGVTKDGRGSIGQRE